MKAENEKKEETVMKMTKAEKEKKDAKMRFVQREQWKTEQKERDKLFDKRERRIILQREKDETEQVLNDLLINCKLQFQLHRLSQAYFLRRDNYRTSSSEKCN